MNRPQIYCNWVSFRGRKHLFLNNKARKYSYHITPGFGVQPLSNVCHLRYGGDGLACNVFFFGTAVALVVVSFRGIHPLTLFLRYIIHSQCKLWLLLWTFCTYCVNFQYKCRYNHKSVKNKHALSLVKSHFKPFAHLQKRKCHKLRVFWRNLFAS